MVAQAQKMGYYVIYYDTEGAVDVDNIQAFGVDP
jgi:RecA/RadA recombinase